MARRALPRRADRIDQEGSGRGRKRRLLPATARQHQVVDLRAHGLSGLSQQDREDEPDDQGHAATISVGTTKAPSP